MRTPDSVLPVYDAAKFVWEGGVGVTEASALELFPGAEPGDPVWDDSCDVGFWLSSRRTGARKLFLLDQVVEKGGSTVVWIFRSEEGFKAHVLNT